MKKLTITSALAGFILSAMCGLAVANDCNLTCVADQLANTVVLKRAIEDGTTTDVCNNNGEKFVVNLTLNDSNTWSGIGFTGTFTNTVGNKRIAGIDINVIDANIANPILDLTSQSGGTITLEDIKITGVKNGGIKLSGAGKFILKNVMVTGTADKTGECIRVESAGAVLENVTVSGCNTGIEVAADDVKVLNSDIYDNKRYGIHVEPGRSKVKVKGSQMFGNGSDRTHGISGTLPQLQFYKKGADNKAILQDAAGAIDAGQDTLYVDLPNDKITANGEFEVFVSGTGCAGVSNGQPCLRIDNGILTIGQNEFTNEKIIKKTLPPDAINKELVAIYTDEAAGSTAISPTFKISADATSAPATAHDGVIAFVQTPYDIPTSTGAGETEGESAAGGEGAPIYVEGAQGTGDGGNEISSGPFDPAGTATISAACKSELVEAPPAQRRAGAFLFIFPALTLLTFLLCRKTSRDKA